MQSLSTACIITFFLAFIRSFFFSSLLLYFILFPHISFSVSLSLCFYLPFIPIFVFVCITLPFHSFFHPSTFPSLFLAVFIYLIISAVLSSLLLFVTPCPLIRHLNSLSAVLNDIKTSSLTWDKHSELILASWLSPPMRWAGHVARMGEMGNVREIGWEVVD
jgi:hypothetical protein